MYTSVLMYAYIIVINELFKIVIYFKHETELHTCTAIKSKRVHQYRYEPKGKIITFKIVLLLLDTQLIDTIIILSQTGNIQQQLHTFNIMILNSCTYSLKNQIQ